MKLSPLLVLCAARIESFRRVTRNTECAPAGYAVWTLHKTRAMYLPTNMLSWIVRDPFRYFSLRLLAESEVATGGKICPYTTISKLASAGDTFCLSPEFLLPHPEPLPGCDGGSPFVSQWNFGLFGFSRNAIILHLSSGVERHI